MAVVEMGTSPPPTSLDEARRARLRAQQALEETRARAPEVSRVAGNLRDHRARNHFAESMGDIFRE